VLGQHLLGGFWDGSLEIGESHRLVPGEMRKDRHFPTTVDTAEGFSQTIGADLPIMDVCSGCIRHSYLFVATPLNSAVLHLFSANPEIVSMMNDWLVQLQRDRQKEAEVFVRSMYKKPETEAYLQRVVQASMKVPTDTTVTLLHNMVEDTDFSNAFARIDRPVLFVYEPALQPNADFLKAKLGDRVRLERFDGDGHALFVDDPEKFNRAVDDFVQSLPR
jgi:pimeloyl-ACP methyl ester carboxylesterase